MRLLPYMVTIPSSRLRAALSLPACLPEENFLMDSLALLAAILLALYASTACFCSQSAHICAASAPQCHKHLHVDRPLLVYVLTTTLMTKVAWQLASDSDIIVYIQYDNQTIDNHRTCRARWALCTSWYRNSGLSGFVESQCCFSR